MDILLLEALDEVRELDGLFSLCGDLSLSLSLLVVVFVVDAFRLGFFLSLSFSERELSFSLSLSRARSRRSWSVFRREVVEVPGSHMVWVE